jgi:hypothetical protein
MTRTISLPLHMARTAAQAVLPHVSDDDVTPVLTHACITGDSLVGTDRYSVGRYSIASEEEPAPDSREHEDWERSGEVRRSGDGWDEDFAIPRAALIRLASIGPGQTLLPRTLQHHCRVVIREDLSNEKFPIVWVALEDDGTRVYEQAYHRHVGIRFPPVARLIEEWTPSTDGTARFGLMPFNLDKITKFAGRHEPIEVIAGAAQRKGVLGPMKVVIGTRFVGLLQPNLLVR